jgi:hypothetical protein
LRLYTKVEEGEGKANPEQLDFFLKVGRCRLTVSKPVLKAPLVSSTKI